MITSYSSSSLENSTICMLEITPVWVVHFDKLSVEKEYILSMNNFGDYAVVEYDLSQGSTREIQSPEDPDTPVNIHIPYGDDLSTELIAAGFFRSINSQPDSWRDHVILDPRSTSFEFFREGSIHFPDEILDDIKEKIESNIELGDLMSPLKAIDRPGLPDLLIWEENGEEVIDYFFCEVKSQNDSLHHSQIDWMTRFDFLPAKIVYVLDENEWDGELNWY